jgi:hypothetical protein
MEKPEEIVEIKLTWDELKTVLGAVSAVKNMIDSDKLDSAYIKLSTQYRGVDE